MLRQAGIFWAGMLILGLTVGLPLTFVFSEFHPSQQPSPASGEQARSEQQRPSSGEQKSQSDQRGADKAPHSLVGPEWSLVWVTIGLCGITAALALYTAFLYRTTRKLAIDAKATGDKQVAIAEKQIAIVEMQTNIFNKQKEITSLQYLAEHRPRLKVRNVNIMPPSGDSIGHPTLFFGHGAEIKVALVVVKARPMPAEWVRSIRDQCIAAKVAFHFKQWGGVQKKRTGRTLDGRTWDELPTRSKLQSALAFAE
jgi:hypothetical protein